MSWAPEPCLLRDESMLPDSDDQCVPSSIYPASESTNMLTCKLASSTYWIHSMNVSTIMHMLFTMYTLCPHQHFVNVSNAVYAAINACIDPHVYMCVFLLTLCAYANLHICMGKDCVLWILNRVWHDNNPFMMIVLKSSNDIMQIAWRVLCLCRPSAFWNPTSPTPMDTPGKMVSVHVSVHTTRTLTAGYLSSALFLSFHLCWLWYGYAMQCSADNGEAIGGFADAGPSFWQSRT